MDRDSIKRDLEAILFVWGSPVDTALAAGVFSVSEDKARKLLDELSAEYEARGSGLMIRKMEGQYQLCTRPECENSVREFCAPARKKKLSNAALEVLAIIAYRQPVAKSEIDAIRGVRSDSVMEGLLNRGLIEEKGRGSGLGHPILYGTTAFFLEKFGISSLRDLPGAEE